MSSSHANWRLVGAVVFDLDDTLYPERQFARGGLAHVGRLLEERFGALRAREELLAALERGPRKGAIDRLLESRGLPPEIAVELVRAYREHEPSLELHVGAREALVELRSRGPLAILTDGPLESQRSKIRALGLRAMVDAIVINDEWGPEHWKPARSGFLRVVAALDAKMDNRRGVFCYVGDNPVKDFLGARESGWLTVELRHSDRLDPRPDAPTPEHEAHAVVESFEQLLGLLQPPG